MRTGPGVFDINEQLAAAQQEANRTGKTVTFMVNKLEMIIKPESESKTAALTPG